jgi:hypothetical protein
MEMVMKNIYLGEYLADSIKTMVSAAGEKPAG